METGKYNKLKVIKSVDFGVYLDGGDSTEILLPRRYVPQNLAVGEEIEVFIYHDNEGRLIATTDRPVGTVGEFVFMSVRDTSAAGAFLDWGLMKDLLVPFREQKTAMVKGERYLVHIYSDFITKRIVASSRIDKFLDNIPPAYSKNEEVDLLIADKTELGYKVIIDNLHWGLLYHNEVFGRISIGEKCKGYIKEIRTDDKIDISLYPLGYDKVYPLSKKIMEILDKNNGYLPVNDKSDAKEICSLFSCSKKSFKKAIGSLYKRRFIVIENDGIRKSQS
ncbi:MAG: GntR family transcriptional regulator [Tannerella sp.]|nr:GntR family transcriptional regulator [Tannerella sp.]